METTGDGVAASAKLPTSVKHSKNNLNRGPTLCRMHINGDAPPVVDNPHCTIFENCHVNGVAMAG